MINQVESICQVLTTVKGNIIFGIGLFFEVLQLGDIVRTLSISFIVSLDCAFFCQLLGLLLIIRSSRALILYHHIHLATLFKVFVGVLAHRCLSVPAE